MTLMQSEAPGVFCGRANRLVTPRLEIAPLSRQEAESYLTDVEEYAAALGLAEPPPEPESDARDAFNWLIERGLCCDAESSVWASIWAIVERSSRKLVGNASFKGEPIAGDAEIAYGIDAPYRRQGLMTEAVRAFIDWGRSRRDLRGIVAETLKSNLASQKVLAHAGFAIFGDVRPDDDAFFWRIDLTDPTSRRPSCFA